MAMSQYVPMYDSFAQYNTERYVPTSRMSVSNSVYLPGSEVDLRTGQLKPDRQRRCRTQGKRLEVERLERGEQALRASVQREMKKGGVRVSMRLGILVVAVVLFVCGLCLLVQQGVIADRQKAVNRLERSIADCRSANAALETQIAEASDAATICYAAARDLNMIPAESAEAIHLVAVDTRPRDNMQRADERQTVEANVVADQNAAAQSTHVPTLAGLNP